MMMNDRNKDDVLSEAAKWITKIHAARLDVSERNKFDEWLRDSENRNAYEALKSCNDGLDSITVEILSGEFEKELHEKVAQQDRFQLPLYRVAASVVFVVLTAAALMLVSYQGIFSSDKIYIATTRGESTQIALDDGSTITLNTMSEAEVASDRFRRTVTVNRGEILFNVERDKERPFLVEMLHGDVRVTGTAFNIRSREIDTAVYVFSGSVEVYPKAGEKILLAAGDGITLDDTGFKGKIERFDEETVLAWREGKARFIGDPLVTVVDELNRYFSTPIVLGDRSLENLPVTGEFDIQDQQTAVTALAIAFSLEQRVEPSKITLLPAQ